MSRFKDKVIPRIPTTFQGGFKKFTVSKFTNREKGQDRRLLVFSQGSRAKVVRLLWLKFLWDELTQKEYELFLLLPEVLKDEIKVAFLRALLEYPKKELRRKLNKYEHLLGLRVSSRESYQGMLSRLNIEIYEIERSLPSVPKFSGWVKSSSSVGSKSNNGGSGIPEPLTLPEDHMLNEITIDWYYILTVGEIDDLFSGRVVFNPEEI